VPLPAVLGHEGAGVVEAVGSAVTSVTPGDHVGMTFDSCGTCASCLQGKSSYCYEFFAYNFGASRPQDGSSALSRDGEMIHAHFFGQSSFATHSVARERNLVALDASSPLALIAPFGCGIQTGAGAVLNSLRPPAGSSIAIFGTGAVGISAVMAASISGCAAIVGVDRNPARLALARELGATRVIDSREEDAGGAIKGLTRWGVDFSLETTGSPEVLRTAVDCLAPLGVCGVIGAPALGTHVSLDVNTILTGGRVVRGIVEGDSVPGRFLPRLVEYWKQRRLPVERLMTFYDFDEIDRAANDALAGLVIKPVLRMA
jgi:aryl-alcohol dehydrogenase